MCVVVVYVNLWWHSLSMQLCVWIWCSTVFFLWLRLVAWLLVLAHVWFRLMGTLSDTYDLEVIWKGLNLAQTCNSAGTCINLAVCSRSETWAHYNSMVTMIDRILVLGLNQCLSFTLKTSFRQCCLSNTRWCKVTESLEAFGTASDYCWACVGLMAWILYQLISRLFPLMFDWVIFGQNTFWRLKLLLNYFPLNFSIFWGGLQTWFSYFLQLSVHFAHSLELVLHVVLWNASLWRLLLFIRCLFVLFLSNHDFVDL